MWTKYFTSACLREKRGLNLAYYAVTVENGLAYSTNGRLMFSEPTQLESGMYNKKGKPLSVGIPHTNMIDIINRAQKYATTPIKLSDIVFWTPKDKEVAEISSLFFDSRYFKTIIDYLGTDAKIFIPGSRSFPLYAESGNKKAVLLPLALRRKSND